MIRRLLDRPDLPQLVAVAGIVTAMVLLALSVPLIVIFG